MESESLSISEPPVPATGVSPTTLRRPTRRLWRAIPRAGAGGYGHFGVQSRGKPSKAAAQAAARIASSFKATGGPSHCDRAEYLDEAGFTNVVTAAYWDDRAKFDGWFPTAREQWTGDRRSNDGFGTFIELLYPAVEGYETLSPHWDAPKASPCSPPA